MPRIAALFLFFLLFAACRTPSPQPPASGKAPGARLLVEKIEARDIGRVSLHFILELDNPRPRPVSVEVKGRRLFLDGTETPALLSPGEEGPAEGARRIAPGASAAFPLRLDLDLPRDTVPGDAPETRRARLDLDLGYAGDDGWTGAGRVSAEAVFPRIREPVFTITSIAIMRAELINTRFRVDLQIENPNGFPLDLSALNYELYGAGRFWAEGTGKDPLHIPPYSSAETRLFLVMNFINMRRELLDQIIALRQVPYRFTGSAEIGTGLEHLPHFRIAFDRSGFSEVTE